jgi:hypothetical protein
MITNYSEKVKQNYQGSSYLLPAHGKGGARATIARRLLKKFWQSQRAGGQKEKGVWGK